MTESEGRPPETSYLPNPSPPRTAPPAGSIDTHFHVFGDDPREVRNPKAPPRAPLRAPWQALEAMHRVLGIERGVLVQNTLVQPNYDVLIDDLAARPSYRAVALVDAATSDSDLGRLHNAGVRGVRFHFAAFMQHRAASLDDVQRVASRVGELGWHVVFHIHAEQLGPFTELFREFPTDIVIDHMAHTHYDDGLEQAAFQTLLELQRLEHVWIKIGNSDRWSRSGPPDYVDAIPFGRAIVENGPERLIWGSDWPHALYADPDGRDRPPPDDGRLLDLLEAFAPDIADRRRILVDNPSRLYGFDV